MPPPVEAGLPAHALLSLRSEVNASFNYTNAAERDRLIEAERKFTDDKVRAVIELKRRVCTPENGYTFVVINQKGIDPLSLDMLAKEGIIGIRRAKVCAIPPTFCPPQRLTSRVAPLCYRAHSVATWSG